MSFEEPRPDRPALERWQAERLVAAIRSWVERIRFPDEPYIAYPGLEFASPRQLLVALEAECGMGVGESELGRRYLDSVRLLLTEVAFEDFILSIDRSGSPRSALVRRFLEAIALVRLRWRRRVQPEPERMRG